MRRYFKFVLLQLFLVLGGMGLSASRVAAAENITLNFGPLQFALSVEALRIYADEGRITGNLRDYARFLSEEQLTTLRTTLNTQAEIEPLSLSQFFYSYQGVKILERVGEIIRSRAGQSGFYALRSALILAAASEEGLTPIKFLETIPVSSITIDSLQGLKIINQLSDVLETSDRAINIVQQRATIEAIQEDKSFPEGINPKGEFTYTKESFTLRDVLRSRSLPLDLYLPERQSSSELSPLIVISHGLGSDRTSFDYFAKFLVSHGFAVAVPEHPGSNASQIQNLLEGFANDVTPPEEFLNRPLDISFILDRLSQDYGTQIDTNNVGIIGQSFGAYTALALAGAELNFPNLEQVCSNLSRSFNVSLFLQCLALELPETALDNNFRDARITSAIVINPLTSALFGKEGMAKIEIPLMVVAGSADTVTPALPEQIRAFTWLDTPEKYLVLMQEGTHFSTLNESSGSLPLPEAAVGPNPQVGQNYIKQLGLLFYSDHYDLPQPTFGRLSASYAASISQNIMPLSLIRNLNQEELEVSLTEEDD